MLVRVSDVFVFPNGKVFSVVNMEFNGGVAWVTFVEVEPNDHLRVVGSSEPVRVENSEFERLFANAERAVS